MARPTPRQLAVWRQLQWATALIMGRFRRDLSEVGLTIEEFDVLIHLAWASEGVLPLRELTASMVLGDSLSRSGLTRLLDRLERDRLIRRDLDRRDRRRFDVALTPEGRERFAGVCPTTRRPSGAISSIRSRRQISTNSAESSPN